MKNMTLVIGGSLVLSMMVLAGLASADSVGACVLGLGANFDSGTPVTGTVIGVNVGSPVADPSGAIGFGQGSETNVFTDSAEYQKQCCAETGQAPDCFAPVG